jgi:hypothetical protein
MAREFFDFDPLTGVAEYVDWHADGGFDFTYEQDVTPFVDFAKANANQGLTEHNFKGEGWLYAIIPNVVQMQMLKKGINIMDPNHTKKMVDEINSEYPWLKTTHRHHAL